MTANRSLLVLLLAAALLLAACSGSLRAKFPTEDEVRGKLEKGMTAEQVLATFGEPPGHQWVDVKLGGKVHYIAPVATRTKPGMGYAGFTVYFDRGKVWDWDVVLLNPSYEHRLLPGGARSWQVRVVVIVLLLIAAYWAVTSSRRYWGGRRELTEAYVARAIPELPPDFRFLTHDTTLQTVLNDAGSPSRILKLPLKGEPAEAPITALQYELPNDAALFVLPEPPAQPESRIRAVVYRRAW